MPTVGPLFLPMCTIDMICRASGCVDLVGPTAHVIVAGLGPSVQGHRGTNFYTVPEANRRYQEETKSNSDLVGLVVCLYNRR